MTPPAQWLHFSLRSKGRARRPSPHLLHSLSVIPDSFLYSLVPSLISFFISLVFCFFGRSPHFSSWFTLPKRFLPWYTMGYPKSYLTCFRCKCLAYISGSNKLAA